MSSYDNKGKFQKEESGIWVAKYEMSEADSNKDYEPIALPEDITTSETVKALVTAMIRDVWF